MTPQYCRSRSASDPIIPQFTPALPTIRPCRSKTLSSSTNLRYNNASALARELFKSIHDRLKFQHIDVSTLVFSRFQSLLPCHGFQQEQMALYHTLQIQPMAVSTEDLSNVIPMTIFNTTGTQRGDEKRVVSGYRFYIRSWKFSASELNSLVRFIRLTGHSCFRVKEWDHAQRIFNRGYLTVRYLGVTKGSKDPYERFTDDFKGKSKNTLFRAF